MVRREGRLGHRLEQTLALAAAARAREYAQQNAEQRRARTGLARGMEDRGSTIEDRLWSVQDVSEYLGIPVWTLYFWRSAGTGRPDASLAGACGTGNRTCVTRSPPCHRRLPALGLGEHGGLTLPREGSRFTAYLRYRDYAGRGRRIKRLLKAVKQAPDASSDGEYTAKSIFSDAAAGWLAQFAAQVDRGQDRPRHTRSTATDQTGDRSWGGRSSAGRGDDSPARSVRPGGPGRYAWAPWDHNPRLNHGWLPRLRAAFVPRCVPGRPLAAAR
jgi:hypothetical protein